MREKVKERKSSEQKMKHKTKEQHCPKRVWLQGAEVFAQRPCGQPSLQNEVPSVWMAKVSYEKTERVEVNEIIDNR